MSESSGGWLDCVLDLEHIFVFDPRHVLTQNLISKLKGEFTMHKHLGLAALAILIAFLFYPATMAYAHLTWGSHQHDEDDPNNTTWGDALNSWSEFFAPVTKPIKDTIAAFQHSTYTESTPYYTVSDIGGGFYRCSCGVSYSYYDSHSH
ncbi:hypothetical protein F4X10_00215 [Candidatus Poribacteria bacterium]|nr:hypothetical protein [Candidatus Poribacteria bacterium]